MPSRTKSTSTPSKNIYTTTSAAVLTALATLALAACSGSSNPNPSSPSGSGQNSASSGFPNGTLLLHTSPIDLSAIIWITPLGNLNPPGHTLPTDHIYFYFTDPDRGDSFLARRTTFKMPGDGTVFALIGGLGVESKVFVRQTSTFWYYVDHVILTTPLMVGSKVTAGQVIGTTGLAYAVDLGVVNESLTLGFLSPSRYIPDTLHADGPLKYFDEPVRGQLYNKVQRIGNDLDGKIDFDMPGRLVGNWFIGATTDNGALVFTYDTYDPSQVLIAGSVADIQSVYGIAPTDLDPRNVTVGSGKVRYTLYPRNSGQNSHISCCSGVLLVQMIDDAHVKAERFATLTAAVDFTANARTFQR